MDLGITGRTALVLAAGGGLGGAILMNNTGGPPPGAVTGQDTGVWEEQFRAMVPSVIAVTLAGEVAAGITANVVVPGRIATSRVATTR